MAHNDNVTAIVETLGNAIVKSERARKIEQDRARQIERTANYERKSARTDFDGDWVKLPNVACALPMRPASYRKGR